MTSLQKKIWLLVTVVVFIMAAIWTSLTFYNDKMQDQYNDILERYLLMNQVATESSQIITDLNNYLLTPSVDNLSRLNESKDQIKQIRYQIEGFRHEENDFALTNYEHLMDSLLDSTDRTLTLRTKQDSEDYVEAFNEATRISKYLSEMSLTLIDQELKTYDSFYRGIIEQSEELRILGVWMFLLITLLLVLATYWFSRKITGPVKQLTEAAIELSKGRFDLKIEVKSDDEISFLAKMFDQMRININNYLVEIKQKAQLERELQQNKLLLQESQLISLQSQINPHFLYNTLNTLSKKAYLEGSEETSDLLVSVAGLLRYNLKRLDKSTTLLDEVHVLKQYMDIQKARFTDRLHFHMDIEEDCLSVQIPRLTLQPIVENAVIHAVEPNEDGGHIWFRVYRQNERIRIEIEDDGDGISEENIRAILEGESRDTEGHSTGIGMSNVVNRLRLFYNETNILLFERDREKGTRVILMIPMKGEDNDEGSDCR
ncbi:histidine kinase [Bacillus coahuilensis p1.1.43]|uniref:histidine kinase n=1 Tax=Bacillus coahuilensis p1.1.43 TaxID=1150625 RepID=A0A147K3V1_9BACI|nr:histidine kinase [Bacillus coahuilensis]KUP03923.1 histidine kinase [Bacillus coahuilensis p1.1.43]